MLSAFELALALLASLDPGGLPLLGGCMHGGCRCKRKGLIGIRTLVFMRSWEAATIRQRSKVHVKMAIVRTITCLIFRSVSDVRWVAVFAHPGCH
jgi:hypothetical protein